MHYKFDIDRVKKSLADMSRVQRLLIGASACERMLPNYEKFQAEEGWGDTERLREILDMAWGMILDDAVKGLLIHDLLEKCEDLIPDTDSFQNTIVSAALDSSNAVCLLLEAIQSQAVEPVAEILSLSIDTVDMYIQFTALDNVRHIGPEEEKIIHNHYLMQRELDRQYSDIADIKRIGSFDDRSVNEIKHKAIAIGGSLEQ